MSESVIEVKPRVMGNQVKTSWGVYLDGELIATSKNSFDCDLFANVISKYVENTRVDHHPELRDNPYRNVA